MAEPLQLKDHGVEAQIFAHRLAFVALVVVVFMAALVARYYSLQVTHHEEYATQSDRNRVHVQPLAPNRGLIFDRNGVLLAENRASFTLNIIAERVPDIDATLKILAELVEITDNDLERFQSGLKLRRRPFEAIPLRLNLSEVEIARLAVNEYRLEGVDVAAQLERHYPFGELFAHTVGYVGRINETEMSNFDEDQYQAYRGTYTIGKIGLEKQYEDHLLGTVGYQQVETNAHGRILRELERQNPMPGQDLHLFLDVEVQKAAFDAMEGRRGAVVAVDPRTGGVIAMVSTPSFNPNLFVSGISVENFRALNESSDRPQLNRTVQGQYPPGSTLKPMLGLAGLHTGFISVNSTVRDPGYYRLEGVDRMWKDWNFKTGGHGQAVDIIEAITESCNTFYWDLSFRMGIDNMHQFGAQFGLGQYTGIDIPNEQKGIWPSRQWKREAYGENWYDGDTLNAAVGQGLVLTTPLQLSVMTATLAARGEHRRPRLVRSAINEFIGPLAAGDSDIINIVKVNDAHWDTILYAMEQVVHGARGTARTVRSDKYRMAAKTGTAQVFSVAQGEKYDEKTLDDKLHDQALFVAFAPTDNPSLAVAVVVENGKHGNWVAPVAKQVFDTYFEVEKRRSVQNPEDD
jgi:penicillin-binding protein 2